ncbi:hypothetical protein P7D22_15615 [Lichenihabitans sp. Uapishka_5]|uniref:hypothetical protein n=1 Tax=Lichenihabitans sp. Uapishka_5 TaxID=3037302 RepID=UPI0029E7DCB7|nr:hypothetical protein [Lichenihabitans sp. Uapishka_5]MDX7952598.1 hypothetical protein [Lichenihabitans sp. Uapishka_5]
MPKTLAAEFDTRREAEMTVEHLTQEHGIDPAAVAIVPVSGENSAGTAVDGSDNENAGDKAGTEPHPALAGRLRVSVETDEALADKVLAAFATYGGRSVA